MAYRLFGNPITNTILEESLEYARKLRILRVQAALSMRQNQDRYVKAVQDVNNLVGTGTSRASTFGLVYNATGDTIKFVTSHDWYGKIGAVPYPQVIANGQWGVYVHMHSSEETFGSSAAVVYRCNTEAGVEYDCMLAWSSPLDKSNKKVYTEVSPVEHYENSNSYRFGNIHETLKNSVGPTHIATLGGCFSTMTTTSDTETPTLTAILTLKDDAFEQTMGNT